MRVMRINFSHATYEEADLRLRNLRAAVGKNTLGLNKDFNLRAVLLDTKGPEIRTGLLAGGVAKIDLKEGDTV
jgi:pyruvate kinase